MSEIVSYQREGPVAVVAMRRPDGMNTFTTELRAALHAELARAADDTGVRAVVLIGEGRCFSAGADLRSTDLQRAVAEILQDEYRPVQETIAGMEKPVIAAVAGAAAGIGLSVALQCDLLIMAHDAFLQCPFAAISLLPDGGLSWLLVRQLGYRRAFQLSVECERVDAARCVELGLANRVVPATELRDAALDWARSLCERAPLSVAATKKAMRYAANRDWASTYDLEAELQAGLVGTADNREGIAAFFEKRKPGFTGK